ncbi:DNA-directed DNA/RNA polymerase mu-like isoform X2 [Halichondria panicea]|uniref:DNA-directed DNA/RNA polymerase mu-like isoform X2 n=1 Tax=Halichondria panicea TaxID=6063 RepID=UPI00312B8654
MSNVKNTVLDDPCHYSESDYSASTSSPPLKKLKLELERPEEPTKCLIYIVEKKISSGHLSHLKEIAKKKGFSVANFISQDVTHVVTTLPFERLTSVLSVIPANADVIGLEWLTSSFAEGMPVLVTDRYRLQKSMEVISPPTPVQRTAAEKVTTYDPISVYECQRATLLEHHNHILTDALELLERYYQHLDHKEGDTRALAFRQASCTLKVLPRKVVDIGQITHLPRIGKHSSQVIQDILSTGLCQEVEECRRSEWFQCMELFTSVYGCGSVTANKWYQKGLRSINDIQTSKELQLTKTQKLGLVYYEHLSVPVTREETEMITGYVQRLVDVCASGTSVEAVGGYRRGKAHGHDIDLLLTNPDHTITDTLLTILLSELRKQDVLVHSDVTSGKNIAHVSMGHFHTPPTQGKNRLPHSSDTTTTTNDVEEHEERKAPCLVKRVDFVVSPPEQYPFALVSWTGSKQFNRSLRRYSANELNMTVNAHGIYDIAQNKSLVATTEKEVFSLLKLEYREPWERNC